MSPGEPKRSVVTLIPRKNKLEQVLKKPVGSKIIITIISEC